MEIKSNLIENSIQINSMIVSELVSQYIIERLLSYVNYQIKEKENFEKMLTFTKQSYLNRINAFLELEMLFHDDDNPTEKQRVFKNKVPFRMKTSDSIAEPVMKI